MKYKILLFLLINFLFVKIIFSQSIDTNEINRLILLSQNLTESNIDSCLMFGDSAIKLSDKADNYLFEVKSLKNAANIFNTTYKYDSTIIYYEKILELASENNDSATIGEIYYLIGKTYYKQDKYAKSMSYNFEALSILEKIDKKDYISDIYLDLGRIYYFSNNPDKSLHYYEKALRNASEISDSSRIAKIYSWLGYAYGQKNLDSLSLDYHKKALDVVSGTDNLASIAIYTSSVGDSYIKLSDYDLALEYILKANLLFDEINHIEGYSWTLMSSSNCYRELGDLLKAQQNADKAFEISSAYKLNNIAKLSSESLYNTYKLMNNNKKALEFLENFNAYSDTLLNEGKLTEMAEIQTKFEIEKQELENLMLKSELELQNKAVEIQKVRNRFLFSLFFALLAVFFIIFLFLRYKNKSLKQKNELSEKEKLLKEKQAEVEKTNRELIETELKNTKLESEKLKLESEKFKLESEKLKDELEFKNKELMNFALHITEKNEFLERLKSEIKEIKEKLPDERVKELYLSINQTLQIDSDREKFQIHIEEVHHSFFHKLDAKYPDLTKGEKKLLALLMMNLSSKEIASTMNISPASVNTKRYRLRKKLEMETDESLVEFLKKL